MFFSDLKQNPFKLINIIFASIILAIFIYSVVNSPESSHYPISSQSKLLYNETSLSTGLSRSFSSIVRLNFEEAKKYNVYGLQIFTIFLIQFFMRVFFILGDDSLKKLGSNNLVTLDALISGGLFILFFMPFLKDLM